MKQFVAALSSLIFFQIFLLPITGFTDSVTHDWPGTGVNGSNMIDVDDQGGSYDNNGNDNNYFFIVDGVGQTSTLTLYLFDGQAVDDGADIDDLGDDSDSTGEDFGMGSGLQILEPPSVLVPPLTEIGALSDNPLTPLSFHGNETGLDVQMLSYVQGGMDFVIFEYVVSNNTGTTVPVKIGLGGDFDVDEGSGEDNNGKDLGIPVLFIYDSIDSTNPGFFYAAGLALAGGTLDNYRLGACCDTTFANAGANTFPTVRDIQRKHYFNARPNEECDDGGNTNGDGCSANCLTESGAEACGNGIVEAGEGCDDGNVAVGDGCDAACLSELCGDGTLDPGEECDDGANVENDGCSGYCTAEFNDANHFCGDGAINNGGVGDQFLTEDDAEVTLSADLGTLAPGESGAAAFCVVGGISPTDGPNAGQVLVMNAQDCVTLYQQTIAICGNSIQNAGEECDDGNTVNEDGCDGNCTLPGCGNGVQNTGEACDDGNILDGDGCDSVCNIEAGPVAPAFLSGGNCELSPQSMGPGFGSYLIGSLSLLLGWGWKRWARK